MMQQQAISPDFSWQNELRKSVRTVEAVLAHLDLPVERLATRDAYEKSFPLLVTDSYLARMEKGNPRDPLLLQVLPRTQEAQLVDGFTLDAVGDAQARKNTHLIAKYRSRALLTVTSACAIHCRFCFRKHFPYEPSAKDRFEWRQILEPVAQDLAVHEVILSGGDPLTLSDARLAELFAEIEKIKHVHTVRIHTRIPIVLPIRITSGLLNVLMHYARLKVIVVLHANHANELENDAVEAIANLRKCVHLLLNQSVLLKDINDSVRALENLSYRLVELGVLPYYLHQLDRVQGTHHFEVCEERGKILMRDLAARLPGYALPKYVKEEAGKPNKTLIPY